MANTERFGITEDGEVFEVNGRLRRLGSLAHLMETATATAQAVQEWWRAQVESDEQLNIIDVVEQRNGRRQYVVRCPRKEMISGVRECGEELAA